MALSVRTSSGNSLMTAALGVLAQEGYAYDPKTTSLNQYLATALTGIGGTTVSHLNMSTAQLLAALVNEMQLGPVSHLTTSVNSLLAIIANR